jgi:GNAT superfamily N-acetyltransferase
VRFLHGDGRRHAGGATSTVVRAAWYAPPTMSVIACRAAGVRDVEAIAALHADSWRRNYRGAYRDEYLDGDVAGERLVVWRERLTRPAAAFRTIVAERDGAFVGFAHLILDEDPTWGALLENLHVVHAAKRHGIGTRLLAAAARTVLDASPGAALHLWVLDVNVAAQAFYAARGGVDVGTEMRGPFPGGGAALAHRIVWRDPSPLVGG